MPASVRGRAPLLILGLLSLIGGVLAGLARLGWSVPPLAAAQAGEHAALVIAAFFGAVLSLERAVALRRTWAYGGPACAGLSGLALLAGVPMPLPALLAGLGSAVLLTGSILILRRQKAAFTLTLALAAACWLIGNLTWLVSGFSLMAAPWWLAFLVLTIAGERLELTRLLPPSPPAERWFALIVTLVLAGGVLGFWFLDLGLRVYACGVLALALWLSRQDIAWRNLRQTGLTRFIAICLCSGYVWLGLAGTLGLAGAFLPGHPWRDAAIHGIGLGFVFAMILGHAPVIVPAVLRIALPYHAVFYLPLAALHTTLVLRTAGVLTGDFVLRRAGGLANAFTLLLFILVLLGSAWRGRHAKRRMDS